MRYDSMDVRIHETNSGKIKTDEKRGGTKC